MVDTTGDSSKRWEGFLARMHELKDLDGVLAVLSWDEETYAPAGARAVRGQQTATVEGIRHQRLVDPGLGDLIEALDGDEGLDEHQRRMVRRLRRRRDLAVKVPESLVKAIAEKRSRSLDAWQKARAAKSFADFEPHLCELLGLLRAKADALGAAADGGRYDALLDEWEPEMRVERLAPVLEELRQGLVPLVESILSSPVSPDRSFLRGPFDLEVQWRFTMKLLADLGFDFEHGRQDRSAHPFTSASSEQDVRLTTRIFGDNPLSAIFSTIHECGHGLYEQGFPSEFHRTSLAEAPSMGIHESQSRLWENQVGRSRAFWLRYLPRLRDEFPTQLEGVDLDRMYRAVNVVEATPIRVEADEVTYNLHILVRFELEQVLLDETLSTKDLPEAWAAKMKKYLRIVPKDDAEGCLQDIHWSWGAFAYFPTYALGNIYAAQLMASYERAFPGVWEDVQHGRFGPLLEWLRAHIHRKGYLESAEDTVRHAVGGPLDVKPLLEYLKTKYGELYRL